MFTSWAYYVHMNIDYNLIEQITKLTNEWRSLISKDHCKDRDFHWYIETRWSYGNVPVFVVVHHGYVADRIENEYFSYEGAVYGLIETLEYWIKQEKESAEFNTLNDVD